MTQAQTFMADDEFGAVLAELPRLSAASGSTSRWDTAFEDGTAITVTSVNGADAEVVVREAEPHELADLAAVIEPEVAP